MDNATLLIPVAAGLIAQIIKFFIKSNRQKFNFKGLTAYSGMPSGHSALVVSLLTIIGLTEGVDTPFFAIAFILATVVIRDALGIRRYLGEHGKILNILVRDLKDDNVLEQKYPHLLERIGHTPLQVAVGGLIGFITSIAGYMML